MNLVGKVKKVKLWYVSVVVKLEIKEFHQRDFKGRASYHMNIVYEKQFRSKMQTLIVAIIHCPRIVWLLYIC